MLTITDEFGTFEVENENDVARMIRKRKADHKKAEAEYQANYARANELARLAGFHVYRMIRETFRNSDIVETGANYCSAKRTETAPGAHSTYSVELETGVVSVSFFCSEILVSVLVSCAGYPFCIFTRDDYGNRGTIRAYTIGAHNGVSCLVDLPGVTPSDFQPASETAETVVSAD